LKWGYVYTWKREKDIIQLVIILYSTDNPNPFLPFFLSKKKKERKKQGKGKLKRKEKKVSILNIR